MNLLSKKSNPLLFIIIPALFFNSVSLAQIRQIYVDNNPGNQIVKLSFYSPSEGYVAFSKWIGYTTDSGKTYTQKYITNNNVNFNGYNVNLTFGFGISGVKAFSKNNIIVYGNYGFVSSILYSTDGGNNFTLVYCYSYNAFELSSGVSDMVFPTNDDVGYAIDADYFLKTTDGGHTWRRTWLEQGGFFDQLQAIDDNNVIAMSSAVSQNSSHTAFKTTNGGASWYSLNLPQYYNGVFASTYFLSANVGWVSLYNPGNSAGGKFYKTTDGGNTWVQQNNTAATAFSSNKMKFVDDTTGYSLNGFEIYKTTNSGAVWERLPRDNNFTYLGYSFNDLQFASANQFWVGGGHGFLEISINSGGTPQPTAYFAIDTTGLALTTTVNLVNYSRKNYTYKWLVNKVLISTAYNASYTHDIYRTLDTVELIVSNGKSADTSINYQSFYPPVAISSIKPDTAATGATVTITGINFNNVGSVSFGGVSATSFRVASPTIIYAKVGNGASGAVQVTTLTGKGSLPGFVYVLPPNISSFSPAQATAGTTITITGANFTSASAVSFGGVAAAFFTVVSPTTIKAVTPSGPSGNITVTTPGGTAVATGFVSLPTVKLFTPLHGTQGTIITIVGTCLNNTTTVSIGGIAAASYTVVSSDTVTAVVGTGASGNVVVSSQGGSSSVAAFTWFAPPVVNSFSPSAGPVGTTVTIKGVGFDAIAQNNIVYFGAVRALVTSGSATTLTVTVPTGATFAPITVTSNNLVGSSAEPFIVTFANGGSITPYSFTVGASIPTTTGLAPVNIALSDLDGDGKTDLIVSGYSAYPGILLYRNTSTDSTVSFDTPVLLPNLGYNGVAVGDLDGDGRPDLAVINVKDFSVQSNAIATLLNTSTPGQISFSASYVLPTANAATGIAIADVDGDGKADIAISEYPNPYSSVYRNISNPGNILFDKNVDYPGLGGRNVVLTDLNGDGKPDLVVPNAVENSFYVFKNSCAKGNISFEGPITFPGYNFAYMAAGDIDGDGKTDLISSDNVGSHVAIFRNTSANRLISLAQPVLFSATSNPSNIEISDIDGDGKVDIVTTPIDKNMAMFKNNSTPGNIAFLPQVDFNPGNFESLHLLAIGDINSDGKNDVVAVSQSGFNMSVFINHVKPAPSVKSFTPTLGTRGTTVAILGDNFAGTTSVSFGGVQAASFVVNSDHSITAMVATGASGNVSVTNKYGTGSLPGFVFGIAPVITSISPAFGNIGSTITITGKNFSPTVDSNIVYFGGARAAVTSASNNSLSVTVPVGATYQPVTVTINGLTAYSTQLFGVIFPGGGNGFSKSSFMLPIRMQNTSTETLYDVDGDGKLDIVYNEDVDGLAVARNTSSGNTVSFEPNVFFTDGYAVDGSCFGDMDGDGKIDIVAINGNSPTISLMRNTSTPGKVSFATVANYSTGPMQLPANSSAAINDLDGDGKPDVILSSYKSNNISIFPNASTKQDILLGTHIDFGFTYYPQSVVTADVNGDRKPDIIVDLYGWDSAAVLINTSVPGTVSFANPKYVFVNGSALGMAAGDLDGDGKTDLAFADGSKFIKVLRNTCTLNSVAFAEQDIATSSSGPYTLSIADLDGDGKPDICAPNLLNGQSVSIIKNVSTPGHIAMQPNVDYGLGPNYPTIYPYLSQIGDINGDGIPDVVVSLGGGLQAILINTIPSTLPLTILNFTATKNKNTVLTQWQTASEVNTNNFNVERSIDAVHFTTVGTVAATGNSNMLQQYKYNDDILAIPNTIPYLYYRLKEVDKDGTATYSNVVRIGVRSKPIQLVATPNPAKAYLNVRLENYSGKATFYIFDMAGHKLQQITQNITGSNTITLNTNTLATGVYAIEAVFDGGMIEQKFVRQ